MTFGRLEDLLRLTDSSKTRACLRHERRYKGLFITLFFTRCLLYGVALCESSQQYKAQTRTEYKQLPHTL